MSQDIDNCDQHPVPKALQALENLIEACKNLAIEGEALDEFEQLELYEITEKVLSLYDRFTDRELVEVFEENGAGDDPDIQAAKERVKIRLLQNLQQSTDPQLQKLALKSMPTSGKSN